MSAARLSSTQVYSKLGGRVLDVEVLVPVSSLPARQALNRMATARDEARAVESQVCLWI
jgi:hypothetical protein